MENQILVQGEEVWTQADPTEGLKTAGSLTALLVAWLQCPWWCCGAAMRRIQKCTVHLLATDTGLMLRECSGQTWLAWCDLTRINLTQLTVLCGSGRITNN